MLSKSIQALLVAVAAVGLTVGVLKTTTFQVGTNGSTYRQISTVTTTIDVASLTAFAATSQSFFLPGARAGDTVIASVVQGDYAGPTSTATLAAKVTANDIGTFYFVNASSATINYGASIFAATLLGK